MTAASEAGSSSGEEAKIDARPVSWSLIHHRTHDLLEVPPVLLVTEVEPIAFRQRMAHFVDGRHVNDVLYRAILAIRRHHCLTPHAYVVAFPSERFELPIEIHPITGEATRLVAFVKTARSVDELPFELAELDVALANHLRHLSREQAITLLKSFTEDGTRVDLTDVCDSDLRFVHSFHDGVYLHSYRYVAATISELDKHGPARTDSH